MSSQLGQHAGLPSDGARPVTAPGRPRLTVVPQLRRRTRRLPFVLLVVLALGAGLVGLLLLNTSLQQGAFRAAALDTAAAGLLDRQQELELKVEALRDPARVARRAQRLGMVASESLAFLELPDGRVLGVAKVATPVAVPRDRGARPGSGR